MKHAAEKSFETREYKWVVKVIKSCNHPAQLVMCESIMELYLKQQEGIVKQDELLLTNLELEEIFLKKANLLNYHQYKAIKSIEKI